VAATRKRARRRSWRRRNVPWLLAGAGALAARTSRAQSSIDARFLFYKESGGRTQVFDPVILIHNDFGDAAGQLNLLLGYDSISGASPTGGYPTVDATTSASGRTTGSVPQASYNDSRKTAGLSYSRKFGAHLPTVDLSYSKENDYTARSAGISDAWTLFGGRGTLHAGFSLARDVVNPVTNDLSLDKKTNGFSLGGTWIVTERDLFDLSASLQRQSGYLDDPYKVVPLEPLVFGRTVPEHRPDSRSRKAVVGKYGHAFGSDGALKLTYRYYWDDWSISAHTLEATYEQKVEEGWIVAPQVRLYTQTGASFYGSAFVNAPVYRSADYRLSPLWSILGGLTVTRRVDERLSLSAGATYQSQTGRDRVTPLGTAPSGEGVGTTSAADLTVLTITLGMSYRY
jgi:hypothetical protein